MTSFTPAYNKQAFFSFIKLPFKKQVEFLRNNAMLLDSESTGNLGLNLYFLNGFFVEETILLTTCQTIELIPFKQGYRLRGILALRNSYQPGYF